MNGYLLRTDYYSYGKMFSEFYAPKDGKEVLYQRRFYNEDGSTAYEEFVDGDSLKTGEQLLSGSSSTRITTAKTERRRRRSSGTTTMSTTSPWRGKRT